MPANMAATETGADPGGTGGHVPPNPQVFFLQTSSCIIFPVYGHYGNVPFKRLALSGPAVIVNYFAGSAARRQKWLET